jgi:hypothetical protein
MPRGGSDAANAKKAAANLRREAARARRLAAGLTTEHDSRVLTELADKLEAEAATLERAAD